MKKLGQMTINSNLRKEAPFIMGGDYSTFNSRSPQMKTNYSSLFGPTNTKKDLLLSKYYKELFIKQVDLKLDEKVYELIAKMHDTKAYSEAKEKYDETKRELIMEVIKNKPDSSQYMKNPNIVNMKNFEDKLLHKFSYYEKDNQIMCSFFKKLKARKKKVYKYKIKKTLDGLYQGNVALYKKRKKELLEQKKKPVEQKFDLSIYLKSNAEIKEYIKNFKRKKVLFGNNTKDKSNNEENNSINRSVKKKKTFVEKKNDEKIHEYFKDFKFEQNRRKSLGVTKSTSFNFTNLHSFYHPRQSKQRIPPLNLPNINDNINDKKESSFYNSNKSIQKDKKEEEIKQDINIINFNENEKNKEMMNDDNNNNNSKNEIDNDNDNVNRNDIQKEENKDDKIDENENIKDDSEINDNKRESLLSDKNSINSKNSDKQNKLNNFSKINNLKVNKTRNKKRIFDTHKHSNTSLKYKNEILSELNNEKDGLTMSASKLNKSLKNFKNTKENFNTIKKIKKSSSQNDIIPAGKKVGVVFKELSENNSQFHFPLINKIFYKKEKGECDMIDRIKYNLKHEYSEKLKQKKIERKNSIDGREIINKLNDQYALEKLFELSEMYKKKRRQEQQY